MDIMKDLELYSVTPIKSPLKLDIMFGEKWGGYLSFPCTVGQEYTLDELKAFARMKKPSLANKDFDILPTAQPVFR